MTRARPGAAAQPEFGPGLRKLRQARDLSQLAMAGLCGTSQRHISFLESGRSSPSREMVQQIAGALGLSLRDQNRLLLLAGFAPRYPQRDLGSADMEPVRQALERMLRHHEPFPAIVVDRRWDLVMVNDVVVKLFRQVGDQDQVWKRVCPDGRRNVLRMIFHPEGLRGYIRNFNEMVRVLLARVQREAAENTAAADVLDELVRELDLPQRWEDPADGAPPSPVFATHLHAGGVTLRLFTMISTFGTPQDVTADELRVGSFFPADEDSDRLLRRLVEAPP